MMVTMRRFIAPGLVLTGVLVLGCNGNDDEDLPPPTIQISVTPSTIASGDMVTIDVQVQNFTLSDGHDHDHDHDNLEREPASGLQADGTPRGHGETWDGPREGHYHVYLNDFMTNPLAHAYEHQITLTIEAEPGEHELLARLHSLDHRIIMPEITDSTPLTVQ
jgi:hypothetical protein